MITTAPVMASNETPSDKQWDVPVGFVYVDRIPTQVISYGDQWLRVTDPTKPLVLVIPGEFQCYVHGRRRLVGGLWDSAQHRTRETTDSANRTGL